MNPSEAAIHCEAVKVSLSQTKDGVKITFVIHPSDMPQSMLTDHVGTRYMMALARIGDDEQVDVSEEVKEGKRLVTSAALLCKEPSFWNWLNDSGYSNVDSEDSAATAMCIMLSIDSRSKLASDKWAQNRFREIRHSYMNGVV